MLIFFHSGDADGHCSGAIVKMRYPDAELFPMNYGHTFPWDKINENETVFMVDFSIPIQEMIQLDSMCDFIWIDHHETAISEAESFDFNPKGKRLKEGKGTANELKPEELKAGCELTWEYLFPEKEVPWAVRLLSQYDVWNHEDPDVLKFQYGLRTSSTWPQYQSLWKALFTNKRFVGDIINKGEIILNYVTSDFEKYCKVYSFETIFEGYRAICCNRGFCGSKLFDSKWDEDKYDIMILFVYKPKIKKWVLSFYTTKKDIHVGELAKKFGGGGHPNASGAEFDELPKELLL